MINKHFWAWIALFVALILNGWFIANSLIKELTPAKIDPLKADFLLEDVTQIQTDKEGQLSNRIHASKLMHYPQNNSTYFEAPVILIQQKSATALSSTSQDTHQDNTWQVTAQKGDSLNGDAEVHLERDVIIQRLNADPKTAVTIKTEYLTAYPKREWAETDRPVTINQGNNVIQAIGLQANLKEGIIKLLRQVEGRYESTQ